MVWEDLRPSHIMTRQSIENAITACMALGGSGRPAPRSVLTSTPVLDANVGVAYSYQATAADLDNDALTFSIATSGSPPARQLARPLLRIDRNQVNR